MNQSVWSTNAMNEVRLFLMGHTWNHKISFYIMMKRRMLEVAGCEIWNSDSPQKSSIPIKLLRFLYDFKRSGMGLFYFYFEIISVFPPATISVRRWTRERSDISLNPSRLVTWVVKVRTSLLYHMLVRTT